MNVNVETGMPHFTTEQIHAETVTENVQNPQLQAQLEPRPIREWAEVAAKFANVPLLGDQHRPRFLPSIDLITGVTTMQKAREFVAVWRIVKLYWLSALVYQMAPPPFATRKAWKSFTAGSFSTSEIQPDRETSIARIDFAEFLGFKRVLSLKREDFAFLKDEVPGPVDKVISFDMVRETVRELLDLNFFFDMFEIEYRRTYDPPNYIHKRMHPVLQPGTLIHPAPIPRSDLSDRAKWLVAVRDFMQDWQGPKSSAFNAGLPSPATLNDVAGFETSIANLYCHNVTYILRRRPTVPRYL